MQKPWPRHFGPKQRASNPMGSLITPLIKGYSYWLNVNERPCQEVESFFCGAVLWNWIIHVPTRRVHGRLEFWKHNSTRAVLGFGGYLVRPFSSLAVPKFIWSLFGLNSSLGFLECEMKVPHGNQVVDIQVAYTLIQLCSLFKFRVMSIKIYPFKNVDLIKFVLKGSKVSRGPVLSNYHKGEFVTVTKC